MEVFDAAVCEESYSNLPDFNFTFPQGMTNNNVLCAGDKKGGRDACQVRHLIGDSHESNLGRNPLNGLL